MSRAAPIPHYAFAPTQPRTVPLEVLDLAAVLRHGALTHVPHRHDFYEIIWFRSGSGTHSVDFQEHAVAAHTLFCLAPGQVHRFGREVAPTGKLLLFKPDFLASAEGVGLLPQLSLFDALRRDYAPCLHLTTPEAAQLEEPFAALVREYDRPADFASTEALRNHLQLFLLTAERIYRQCHRPDAAPLTAQHVLFQRFRELLDAHLKQRWSVADYAAQLAVTPRRLTQAVQALVGRSAGAVIEERLVLEAKRLLANSHLSAKEVAFELGFDDPSYFHKFFKRATGGTAQEFRKGLVENYP